MPAIKISKLVDANIGRFRRVGHSGQQWFTSIDRQSFGLTKTPEQVVNAASTFAGTAGGVAGAIAIGMSTAAAGAVAGAGFLAAVAGPQIAVTAAVVGLALLIKGAYSNREAAHKKLLHHVWSMVDDTPPEAWTPESLEASCEAAMTLMEDGKNQIKLLGSKLNAAKSKFEAFNKTMEDTWAAANAADTASRSAIPAPQQEASRQRNINLRASMYAAWTKETKSGGAVFEYVRRLAHTANYIQAPHVIALAMAHKLKFGATGTAAALPGVGPSDDFFKDMQNVKDMRAALATQCARYDTYGFPDLP